MSRDKLTITIFNATGISKYAVDSILTFTQHTSLLFLIETWLLPPNQLLTNWQQHHTYGEPRSDTYSWIGKMGISLLVHPDFNLPVHGIEDSDPHFSKYHLTCTVANTLIHCLYLPHLSQLPMLSPSSPVYHSVTPTLQTHFFAGTSTPEWEALSAITLPTRAAPSSTTGLRPMALHSGTKNSPAVNPSCIGGIALVSLIGFLVLTHFRTHN